MSTQVDAHTGPVDDLVLIKDVQKNNEQQSSVMDFGAELDVVLDWHGKVVACGYPAKETVVVVERRDDFNDVVHTLSHGIRSERVRRFLRLISEINMVRGWSNGDMSLSQLLLTLETEQKDAV
jgi:hypothetical protein